MNSKTDSILQSDITDHGTKIAVPMRPLTIIAVIAFCLTVWGSIAYFVIT